MARAVFRSGEHKSISGGSEDGAAAIRARTHCSEARGGVGATASALHLGNGRRVELLLSDEQQLPRVLELLEQPT
jgi:hypothetical protein